MLITLLLQLAVLGITGAAGVRAVYRAVLVPPPGSGHVILPCLVGRTVLDQLARRRHVIFHVRVRTALIMFDI